MFRCEVEYGIFRDGVRREPMENFLHRLLYLLVWLLGASLFALAGMFAAPDDYEMKDSVLWPASIVWPLTVIGLCFYLLILHSGLLRQEKSCDEQQT